MKRIALLVLLCCTLLPAGSHGGDLRESLLNKGIRNADEYSRLLISQARGSSGSEAAALLRAAAAASPDLPMVYFELAKFSFNPSVQGILDSVDYAMKGLDAYGRNFWWSFTLYGSLFFAAVLSFVAALAAVVVIRLWPDIPLVMHDAREAPRRAVFLLALPALSLLSPLFFMAGVLMLIGIYMKRSDRALVYAYLLLLIMAPLIFKAASTFLEASSSGRLKALIQVNEARGNNYAVSALKDGTDASERFSYALAARREGRCGEAIPILQDLTGRGSDPRLLVNLGNCHVALYNFEDSRRDELEKAARFYSEAIAIKPLATGYYNLSQVSREMLDFPRGEEYFKSAVSLDRTSVGIYRAVSGRVPNRLVADETLTRQEIWDYVVKTFSRTSTLGLSLLPASAVSAVALGLTAAFYLLTSLTQGMAYRCRKCSVILCNRCERSALWGRMCPQCYASLVKLEEMDARERVARILTIYERQRRRRMIMRLLSFILPGAPFVYGGRIVAGFLFLWPFFFLVLLPLTNRLVVPDGRLVSHGFFSWTALTGAAILFVASNLITRGRMARGWL